MKIIEALKELPLLQKRIDKNIRQINMYASDLDRGEDTDLPFKTEEAQKAELESLIQSTKDLIAYRASLRRRLAITNANVVVEIEGMSKTIMEWIEYRERGMNSLINIYQNLTDHNAQRILDSNRVDVSKGVKAIRFFDEKERNEEVRKLALIKDSINARLEIVNATTDLV